MEISNVEYIDQYLPALRDKFHEDTQNAILQNREEIYEKLIKQMQGFVTFVGKFQEQVPVELEEVQIALLQTSVHLNKPQVAISAYGEGGLLGTEVLNIKYDASWLFTQWEAYRQAIINQVVELHAEKCIREAAVRQMMWESMDYLIYCLYAVTKYMFTEFDHMRGFDNLLLTEDFRLSVGGYRDWRRVLFCRRKPVDIFFREKKDPITYAVFCEAVYNRKKFEKLDLTKARFYDCEFVHCTFSVICFRDTVFENCRFYHCTFEETDFCGATMRSVTMKKDTFSHTTWNFVPDMEHLDTVTDIYKGVEWSECVLESLTFTASDVRGMNQAACTIVEVELQECENDGNVFEEETV